MTAIVKHAKDVPAEPLPVGSGAARQVLIGAGEAPHFAMRKFSIQPGGGMPTHTNTVEHEQYVLAGRAKIGIGDRVSEVTAGDVVFIPAGTPHWYETQGQEAFEFLCLIPNLPDRMEILKR